MYLRYNTRKGHRYYSIVEAKRSGDQTKQKTIIYFGRIDNKEIGTIHEYITRVERLNNQELLEKFRRELFVLGYTIIDFLQAKKTLHFGDVAVFYKIAELLEIPKIIRKNAAKGGGPDAGKITTIMAICQALAPTSKNDLRNWYEETALPYITEIKPEEVEEWILYSCMRHLTKERIEQMEMEIIQSLIQKYEINMDTWLYDLTSIYFYCRKDYFKRLGYSRDHMKHLAQVIIGLAVTKEDGFPIKHWVYPGNTADVKTLPDAALKLKQLYRKHEITLVFDRGNLSETNVITLDGLEYNYICGLKRSVSVVKDLITAAKNTAKFELIKTILDDDNREQFVYGTSLITELWGKQRKVVICYSEALLEIKRQNRQKAIDRAKKALAELQEKTEERNIGHDRLAIKLHEIKKGVTKYFDTPITDHPPQTILEIQKIEGAETLDQRKFRWLDQKLAALQEKASEREPDEVRAELKAILGKKKRYYHYRVKSAPEYSTFTWRVKTDVVTKKSELDGFYALMSTNLDISIEDITAVNDSRDIVEKCFQTLKQPVKIRPVRHWVPQMVRAHVYICILGYFLRQMLQFLIKRNNVTLSINQALVALRRIKAIEYGISSPEPCCKLTHLTPLQKELLDLVGLRESLPFISKGI